MTKRTSQKVHTKLKLFCLQPQILAHFLLVPSDQSHFRLQIDGFQYVNQER